MKRYLLLVLLASLIASCKSANDAVVNAVSPKITGFSPDTVWTFRTLTIYGTNFGYDRNDIPVTIDTAHAQVMSVEDTVMTVTVPEYARTGHIHATKLNQTTTSAATVFVNYTFNPHGIYDSIPLGGSFSIPGTGLTNFKSGLHLLIDSITYPIDSVLPDHIVSHVPANGSSGRAFLSDSNGTFDVGMLYVARPTPWKTLSAVWDNFTVTESHHRTGYIDGPAHSIDSTWTTTATYSMERDWNISGNRLARTQRGIEFALTYNVYPSWIGMEWDTISQSLLLNYQDWDYGPKTQLHTVDTEWYLTYSSTSAKAPMPVDRNLDIPIPNLAYEITEDSTDEQGLVDWKETTLVTPVSGTFILEFKQ